MVDLEESFTRFEHQELEEGDELQSCVVSHEIKCHAMCFNVVTAELGEELKRRKRLAAEKAKEEAGKTFWAYEIEYSLDRVFLGADRLGRQYFCFSGASDRLYVRSLENEWYCVGKEDLPALVQALSLPEEKDLARNLQNALIYFSTRLPWDASHHLASQEAVQVAPLRALAVLQQIISDRLEKVPQCEVCGAFSSEDCHHCPQCHMDFDDTLFAQHVCVAAKEVPQPVQEARQLLQQLEIAIPFTCLTKKAKVYWTAEKRAAWQLKGGRAVGE